MTEPIKPLRIFLSYIQTDILAARQLYDLLSAKGFDVWFDQEDLVPGQNWQQEIVKALYNADAILVCFSQSTFNKNAILQKEFKFTVEQILAMPKEHICLIPIRFQPCYTPTQFDSYKWVNLYERDGPVHLIRGLKKCAKDLNRADVSESQPQKIDLTGDINDSSTKIKGNAHDNVIIYGDNNIVYSNSADAEKAKAQDNPQDFQEVLEQKVRERIEEQAREKARLEQQAQEQVEADAKEKTRLDQQTKKQAEALAKEKARLEQQAREPAEIERQARQKEKIKKLIAWGMLTGGIICLGMVFLTAILLYNFASPPLTATPLHEASATSKLTATFTRLPTFTLPSKTSTFSSASRTRTATIQLLAIASKTSTPNANFTISPKDKMPLHLVSAGPFTMGNNSAGLSEKPAHLITLDDYWIDETEITNQMYDLCVKDGACKLPYNLTSVTRPKYYNNPDFADYPVTHVFWKDAKNYCTWAGRSLPSEAQWEKAARGGTDNAYIYPWGNSAPTASLLNYNNILKDTSKVGAYPDGKSPYGALDMAGNVWEWVNDYFDSKYYGISPSTNPLGPGFRDTYSLRGGSWSSARASVRSFYRANGSSGYINVDVGFRCALVP